MKRLTLFALLIITAKLLSGQAGELIPIKLVAPAQPLFLRDYFTTPVKNAGNAGIGGSPFVFDDWLLARIRFIDDRVADSVRIKINALNRTIHYINETGEEFQAIGKIKEIVITDNTSSWNNTKFLSGFESDKSSFFQVLSDGSKMMLLKKTKVFVWEAKAMFEEAKKEFQKEDEFYFYTNFGLYKQNKSCTEIQQALRGNEAAAKFITDNQLKCNKEADMKRLVEFVNSGK